jgi:hypothetical protein
LISVADLEEAIDRYIDNEDWRDGLVKRDLPRPDPLLSESERQDR